MFLCHLAQATSELKAHVTTLVILIFLYFYMC